MMIWPMGPREKMLSQVPKVPFDESIQVSQELGEDQHMTHKYGRMCDNIEVPPQEYYYNYLDEDLLQDEDDKAYSIVYPSDN